MFPFLEDKRHLLVRVRNYVVWYYSCSGKQCHDTYLTLITYPCFINITGQSQRTKLYVGNLSFYTTLDTIEDLFSEYGTVYDCYMPEDRETGGSRGFAFVTMDNEGAATAIDETDGYELDGRIIRVNEAQPKGQRSRDDFYEDDGGEDYEEQESEY